MTTILSLPISVLSTENLVGDILQGCAVVTLTLLAFIGLVWLREQGRERERRDLALSCGPRLRTFPC